MDLILFAWFFVGLFFLGVPSVYFVYMRKRSAATWNLEMKQDYFPSTAILVPVYNEEKTIRLKLANLGKVSYPTDKIEILIVNDSSSDNTLNEVESYIKDNPSQKISLFDSKVHLGKTGCLNNALKTVKADVVIISDADCFWPHDILQKAITYLSDPHVGAITARELLLNAQDTWVTFGEQFYDDTVQTLRIGESKLHSTIVFQGGFAAYKRSVLEEFNHQTDDSGTALDIIQKSKRAILIPEIGFYTISPTAWRNKVTVKIRRASQLQQLWAKCLNLLFHRKLEMPKRIAVPEILLHIFNPLLLVALLVLSAFVLYLYPLPMLALLLLIGVVLLFKKPRTTIIEVFQDNLILLAALSSFLTNKKFNLWKPVEESRSKLSEDMLKEKKLI
jgi:cellulose synthase/poly-beta-1,6-N-acetylglucosamine synthase-like glycosyltransferase